MTIYLAGGCFWGMQKFIDQFEGVQFTEVGYANGSTKNPTYEEVCGGTGHAETVKTVFDEDILPLTKLLDFYFMSIDPMAVNHQGGDYGVQYRTGIYYDDESVRPALYAYMKKKEEDIEKSIAVELKPLEHFYTAEEYHQRYLDKNPGGYCHIRSELFEIGKKQW